MAKENAFGLKEVADVKFYDIPTGSEETLTASWSNGNFIVLNSSSAVVTAAYEFDSLKVSNIEVTSEDTSARGGKGNPELISWSYGKEVTFTMEDALMSDDTLALMFGRKKDESGNTITIDTKSFPGTYFITGSTVRRSYATGEDEPFGFVIHKGKVNVGGTLTMEAEGDPSTFEMTIKALADTDNKLVSFIKAEA